MQGYLRVIKCCIVIGEILEADKNLKIVLNLEPSNPSALAEQSNLIALKTAFSNAETSYSNKDYRQVRHKHIRKFVIYYPHVELENHHFCGHLLYIKFCNLHITGSILPRSCNGLCEIMCDV